MSDPHRIVSSESEQLILVDEHDNEIGYRSKAACHDGEGMMHRAFSLFLFNNEGELLLQKRSAQKRLWPGYWSNSCCSHPRRGESMPTATRRRLTDELNIAAELQHVYHFCYQALFGEAGSENELCHVYLGRVCGDLHPNESEISGVRFIRPDALDNEFLNTPEHFTPWFRQEWQTLKSEYPQQLQRYAM